MTKSNIAIREASHAWRYTIATLNHKSSIVKEFVAWTVLDIMNPNFAEKLPFHVLYGNKSYFKKGKVDIHYREIIVIVNLKKKSPDANQNWIIFYLICLSLYNDFSLWHYVFLFVIIVCIGLDSLLLLNNIRSIIFNMIVVLF